MSAPIRRRFLEVGARRVHYLRAGEGPPVVLVHSSPANAWLLRPEIDHLSDRYTVFAFDTPGFGLSDPLPLAKMTVADLADALAETLSAIAMPPCPIFGTHTGAAIALEFGARHPGRVTGLVLDGVPAFTDAECESLFGGYFRAFPISDLGGHYAEVWTRFRDQYVWFPWTARRSENLNPYDLGAAEGIHAWVSMYFGHADHYMPAYRAALSYGEAALAAAARLQLPAIYTATDTDMLFPHLERLPLNGRQRIERIGVSYDRKRDLIAEGFAEFGGAADAPEDMDAVSSTPRLKRQFIDGPDARQIHIRYAGERSSPPLLLLHDAPGSAAQWEGLIKALSQRFFVVAPDAPGSGESDPLAAEPTLEACADSLEAVVRRLGLRAPHLYGIGFGASLAAALAHQVGDAASLAVRGTLLPPAEERAGLKQRYAPPILVEADGSHWYRTWLMLRDSRIWWPWFQPCLANQRKAPRGADQASFDGQTLHAWTVDVMRRRETYGQIVKAALADDLGESLARIKAPILRLIDPAVPLSVYDPHAADLFPKAPTLAVAVDEATHARDLADRLGAMAPCFT